MISSPLLHRLCEPIRRQLNDTVVAVPAEPCLKEVPGTTQKLELSSRVAGLHQRVVHPLAVVVGHDEIERAVDEEHGGLDPAACVRAETSR
jgi:hypothetical protein